MAYTKTIWKAREGINFNRFTKSEETESSVFLTNAPDVSVPGTPFSVENMNHIEQGIEEAHRGIETEASDLRQETARAKQAEWELGRNIQRFEVKHDSTLTGQGTPESPLSVLSGGPGGAGYGGISARAPLSFTDGHVFKLPDDLILDRLFMVSVNGLAERPFTDYLIDGTDRNIVFFETLETYDAVEVFYSPMKIEKGISARATILPDGTEKTFPLPGDLLFDRIVLVDVNGLIQEPGTDYNLNPASKTITLADLPEAQDTISVFYTN